MNRFIAIVAVSISLTFAWFMVPMGYYDKTDGWTGYFALGFGDSLKYGAAELRYAPKTQAARAELTLDLPFWGMGTQIYGKYITAETFDPRKSGEISVRDTVNDTTYTRKDLRQDVEELSLKIHQRYKAGIESVWGIFVDYRRGKYLSDYRLVEFEGFITYPETTKCEYIGGGLSFGYDTRKGDMDPEAGYVFNIEAGASYLLMDTLDADYVNAATHSPKLAGFIFIDQFIYTPSTALPIDIPILTVQAPTVFAIRTSGAYYTSEVPQLLGIKSSEGMLFRGVPPRKLSGYAYFILSADIRISPIARMYTPVTILHLTAPRTIRDARADVEIIPFVDIGKIYGANPEKQFYTWGLALGLKFGKRLTTRLEVNWTPKFDDYVTTYFSIRQPF